MALPLPPGLTPDEVGFICEMEQVNVIPRQRLDAIELLGGTTPTLQPPFPSSVPLWLALLLKKQGRANIAAPDWLSAESLQTILEMETAEGTAAVFSPSIALPPAPPSDFHPPSSDKYLDATDPSHPLLPLSPPFLIPPSRMVPTAQPALPYHWLELSHLILTHASDDVENADLVRRLVRDVREARASKVRRGLRVLTAGAGVQMNGVGALEVAEVRGFVGGVVDGLRRLNRSREEARRERDAERRGQNGFGAGAGGDEDDDDEMQL